MNHKHSTADVMHSLTRQWQERHIKRCFERHCESVALAPNPRLEKSEDRSRAPLGWRTRFNVQLLICALTVTLRRAAVCSATRRGGNVRIWEGVLRPRICPCTTLRTSPPGIQDRPSRRDDQRLVSPAHGQESGPKDCTEHAPATQ